MPQLSDNELKCNLMDFLVSMDFQELKQVALKKGAHLWKSIKLQDWRVPTSGNPSSYIHYERLPVSENPSNHSTKVSVFSLYLDYTANRVFPAKFSWQGKTISNENRFFPVKKTSQGKPCFHYMFFPVKVCSVIQNGQNYKTVSRISL